MHIYTILRLLLTAFFLYFSWPFIPYAITPIEKLFWGSWLLFFLFVTGGNLATFLNLCDPPALERAHDQSQ